MIEHTLELANILSHITAIVIQYYQAMTDSTVCWY